MGFQQGLSGLNSSSKSLEVIGNNVANANTYGAKSSRAEFADMYAASLGGSGTNKVGIGVRVAAVAQQFTQGNITTTSNPMDLAINGAGFFQVSDGSSPVSYTRNGQFKVDRDGYIVNNAAQRLLG
ncbi:MAG: flagellar hook-basal body complex protein, partial [Aquabacterium sp.]